MGIKRFGFLASVGLFAVGCGGGGSVGNATLVANPLAGSYIGEYINQNGHVDQFQLTIGPSGAVTGEYVAIGGTISSVKGNIDKDGHGNMSYAGGTANIQLNGFASQTATLSISPVQTSIPATQLALALNPATNLPAGNPFAGNYAGIFTDTTSNKSSALAITVSSTGVITGENLTNPNGFISSAEITGTISATGAVSYTTLNPQVTISGQMSQSNLSSAVQMTNGDSGVLRFYRFGGSFGPPPPAH